MRTRYRYTSTRFLFLAVVLAAAAWADVTGTILGTVRDRTNAVIVGVRGVAINIETNFSKTAVSGADGTYRILALPTGTYRVSVEASGFQTFTANDIDVKVNDQLRVDATLDVGAAQNQVSVELPRSRWRLKAPNSAT
ncbi:MAG TPA: carboxypeptidase-like regulatory domain-containing protein [Bryobacteraceae bacterium]|jgi:hypothetical protein|nr:carboxypeptidase-like regulatory domain-containing protein [Bryobacteraceae bacterium]